MPAAKLVKLPDSIGFDTAAAMMLQGMTVQYLLRQVFPLKSGEIILFHAAAGGVGLIAAHWARALGVSIIGTISTEEKAALAKSHGCAHVINYKTENFVERVKEIIGGKGVPVVYDSIGKDTFTGSLDCLSRRGLMVSFGNASGPVAPFRHRRIGFARLPLSDAVHAGRFRRHARGAGRHRRRSVRHGAKAGKSTLKSISVMRSRMWVRRMPTWRRTRRQGRQSLDHKS